MKGKLIGFVGKCYVGLNLMGEWVLEIYQLLLMLGLQSKGGGCFLILLLCSIEYLKQDIFQGVISLILRLGKILHIHGGVFMVLYYGCSC